MSERNVSLRKSHRMATMMLVVMTALFVGVLSFLIFQNQKENEILMRNRDAIAESVREEREREAELSERFGRDLTEDEIIKIARDRFGLVFPNEIILKPVD